MQGIRGNSQACLRVNKTAGNEAIQKARERLVAFSGEFFKDYNRETDKKLFIDLMKMYGESLGEEWLAPAYIKLKNQVKGDFSAIADKIYEKSVFADEQKYLAFIKGFNKSCYKETQEGSVLLPCIRCSRISGRKCSARACQA